MEAGAVAIEHENKRQLTIQKVARIDVSRSRIIRLASTAAEALIFRLGRMLRRIVQAMNYLMENG